MSKKNNELTDENLNQVHGGTPLIPIEQSDIQSTPTSDNDITSFLPDTTRTGRPSIPETEPRTSSR